MISLRVLGFCVLSTLAPLAIGCTAGNAETEEGAESDQAISADDLAEANKLLADATHAAEKRLAGSICDGEDTTVSEILSLLQSAVEKQPTKAFRKKVAASAPIKRAVGHTLDYHYVVGTITVEKGTVLGLKNAVADSEKGIEVYGPAPGVYGNMSKIRLFADGRATYWALWLNEEGETKTGEVPWSWSLEETNAGTTLTFGTGGTDIVIDVKFNGGSFLLPNRTEPSDSMTSLPSECEA